MELAPEVGWGGGRGYYESALDLKPSFEYVCVPGRFVLRRHHLLVRWANDNGRVYQTPGGLLVWKQLHEFCEDNFSLFGNGFMHICYHVSVLESRVEFMRKSDAMLMKLRF